MKLRNRRLLQIREKELLNEQTENIKRKGENNVPFLNKQKWNPSSTTAFVTIKTGCGEAE